MDKYKPVLILLFIFISVLLFPEPVELSILFTGNTSGHPLKFTYKDIPDQGGIPARYTLIKQLAGDSKDANILLLDTGNVTLGTFESNYYEGLPDAVGMNNCGYDAAGVGLSEIWKGTKYFFNIFNKNTKFLILSSNVKYYSFGKKQEYLADNYLVKSYEGTKGIKVGIFSLMNPELYPYLPAKIQKEIEISDPLETAKTVVEQLKTRENVDIVIALTDLGMKPGNEESGYSALAANVPGIDIIIDGDDSDSVSTEPVEINGTKIFQAFRFGLCLGEINLVCDEGKINSLDFKMHPVNYKEENSSAEQTLQEDAKTLSLINAKMKKYKDVFRKKIVKIKKGILSTDNIRNSETEFGDLICDSMLEYTEADVAFQNAGGIVDDKFDLDNINRMSFDGAIKYDNTIVVLFMTGKQIKDTLQYSIYRKNYGGFLQVAGLKFSYSKSDNIVRDITIGDQPLDETKQYKVVTNSWLAAGGDGHKIFLDIKNKLVLKVLFREVVYDYLQDKKTYIPKLSDRINPVD